MSGQKERQTLGRLKKTFQFKSVYSQGKSLASKNIVLYYKKNRDNRNNLGISISKKVGNSVQRHRIKRIYREAFRQIKNDLKEGYDFIIVARKGSGPIYYHEAVNDLIKILSRGKFLK